MGGKFGNVDKRERMKITQNDADHKAMGGKERERERKEIESERRKGRESERRKVESVNEMKR